jgi:hypothetical protein
MGSWTPSAHERNEGVYAEAKAKSCQKVRLTRPHPSIAQSAESIRIENYRVMCRSTTRPDEVRHSHDEEKHRPEEKPQRTTFFQRCHII